MNDTLLRLDRDGAVDEPWAELGMVACEGEAGFDAEQRRVRFTTEIFDETFLSDSVITEDRLGPTAKASRRTTCRRTCGPASPPRSFLAKTVTRG